MNLFQHFYLWKYERRLKELNKGYDYEPATPELTAKRFIYLFNLHGIEPSEIPEVNGFETITLYDLNSNDRLLQKLTPEFLRKTAETFSVRIEWLRSGDPQLYDHRQWYKSALKNFFEDLKEMDFEETYDPFCVIATQDKFDVHAQEYQPFILMLRKQIAQLGDKTIYKYYMESTWDWHHPPCRLQAKGLATRYYQLTRRLIPIFVTNNETFHKIKEGYIPPNDDMRKNHNISFEEYGALKFPHVEAYEKEEWDYILEEMKYYKIDNIEYDYLGKRKTKTLDNDNQTKSKVGRKADTEKQELKDRFVSEYRTKIERKEISCAQAARDFYDNLNTKDEKLLFRSEKDFQKSTSDELRDKAERTLTEYYRLSKKIQRSTDN